MNQLEIVPLRILEFRPLSGRPTAQALGRARAEDDNYYIVKRDAIPGQRVCATEWICTSIADSLQMPVAECRVLQAVNGELLFGSKEIRPKMPEVEVQRLLLDGRGNDVFVPLLAEQLSSTYALDLAVGNLDRHQDNFVLAVSSGAQQQIGQLHLIDFGSSDIVTRDKCALPFPDGSNTVKVGRRIRARHPFHSEAAGSLLSRLKEGSGSLRSAPCSVSRRNGLQMKSEAAFVIGLVA